MGVSYNSTLSLNMTEEKKEGIEDGGGGERPTWDNSAQFFFTVLGFCVGLGNIWRFPYLCQKNGGGAFIIPFIVMLILVGMPLLLLELGLGQKLRLGAVGAWKKVHPALAGVGYGSSCVAAIVGCYYNVIIAWCIYYLASSFVSPLPWSSCPLSQNNSSITECEDSSETQFFWYRTVLDASDSIASPVSIKWWLLACLAGSWILVYLILSRGIASSGKVVYFTALFPYFVLSIFFVRALTLPGAAAGLKHMFTPQLDKLLQPTVWLDAANQVFYSFGLAFGSIISFGSYNPIKRNCVTDAMIITTCNAFTAIYACAVIFAILGFKAMLLYSKCLEHDLGILIPIYPEFKGRLLEDIPHEEYHSAMEGFLRNHEHTPLRSCSLEKELDQAAQGTGLAFIVMAEVFTAIPWPNLWAGLFFMMLLSLGVGSQIGILEGVISTLFDQPSLKNVKKPLLVLIVVLFCFTIGVTFTTGAGEYWLTLFDSFGAYGLTFIAFFELIGMVHVYGHKRFTQDIEDMTGIRPGIYWQATWRVISPSLMLLVLVSSSYQLLTTSPTYSAWVQSKANSEEKEYSGGSLAIAAILAVSSLLPVILGAASYFINRLRTRASDTKGYSAGVMHRVDTSASQHAMLAGAEADADEDDDLLPSRSTSFNIEVNE